MEVYEGIMQGLKEASCYNNGKIKARTRTITVEPVSKFNAVQVKSIRGKLGMTQALFARLMGVSVKTVEAWECGRNTPSGPSARMLAMLQKDSKLPQKLHIVAG